MSAINSTDSVEQAPLPILHADVLIEIMSHVPDEHAARFLLVGSRALYHEAILKTLKRVNLWHSESVGGFLDVLNSSLSLGCSRYLAVHAIDFGYLDSIHSETERCLVEAISQLSNLRELSILYAEELLHDLQTLSPVISNLVSIHSISANYVGLRFCRMLKKMKSPLTYVSMNFSRESEINCITMYDYLAPDLYFVHHPVALLQHMSNSLEELQLFSCHASHNLDSDLLMHPHVYPKMRILGIRLGDARSRLDHFPRVLPYVRAFPHLAELSVQVLAELDTDGDSPQRHTVNSIRAMNQSDLRFSGHFWARLEQFVGFLPDLYMLGPTGPIAKIHLTSWIQALADLSMLSLCLESVRPTHLKLKGGHHLLASSADTGGMSGSLADVLRGPGADGIRSLVVDVDLGTRSPRDERDPRNIDVAHELDTLVAVLKSLSLTRLRMRVKVRRVNRPRAPSASLSSSPSPPPPPTRCIAETSAARMNVPAFLRALCAAVPTLTDAYVALERWSSAELRARVSEDGADSDCAGDPDEECPHWARVPAAREAGPQRAFELEDKEMFELD